MKLNIRNLIAATLFVAFSTQAVAASRAEAKLDQRITSSTSKFEVIQSDPDKVIPPEVLKAAHGIVIMDHVKAGFIFGLKGSSGVALVRDPVTKKWSAPAFMGGGEASFGFQAGVQGGTIVYVLMNKDGLEVLQNPKAKIGVDMRATVGPHSAGGEAKFDTDDTPVLVYSDIAGLFGGLAFEGGAMAPDKSSNKKLYDATAEEILFKGKATPSAAGKNLIKTLNKYSKEQ